MAEHKSRENHFLTRENHMKFKFQDKVLWERGHAPSLTYGLRLLLPYNDILVVETMGPQFAKGEDCLDRALH